MPNLLSVQRAVGKLDADTVAQWLDEVGMPIMLAGAVMTMVAAIAA